MGLLDALRGKKPKLTVTAEPAEALPGDEVRVRVVVEGELDDKVETGRAGIRCLNEYLKREYDRQDEEWDEVWRSVALHEDFGDLPLATGEHELTFTIPQGLPPASDEAVSWWAWAEITRRRGTDAKASQRIAVRLPAASVPSERGSHAPGEEGIGFSDLPASAGAGQTIDGAMTVTPGGDLKATGARVELRRICSYTVDKHTIVKRDTAAEVEVSGGFEVAAGQTHELSFSVAVPPDAGPTASAPHTVVEWRVRAIVARRLRDDLELEVPVVVYDG